MDILNSYPNTKSTYFSISGNYLKSTELQSPQSYDLLKCGSCSSEFLLSDIVVFIQHKASSCHSSCNEDKENSLKCSNCSETFRNAYSLLEHAQFVHKLEIFKENDRNSMLNLEQTKCNEFKLKHLSQTIDSNLHSDTTIQSNTNNNNNNSKKSSHFISKSSKAKNEIFIDVIPSDPKKKFLSRNQSYDITVSSSDSTSNFNISTNSLSNNANSNNNLTIENDKTAFDESKYVYNHAIPNNENGDPHMSSLAKSFNDQNENTSSSSNDSNSMDSTIKNFNTCNDNSINNNDTLPLIPNETHANLENFRNHLNHESMRDSANCLTNADEKRKKSASKSASFLCDICKAVFNQKIHLTKHSAKHTGIKPFKCSECNYSTVERSHLKVHVRVHTGEKPFKCTFCEYATAQSSTLKIHKKRHHERTSILNNNASSSNSSSSSSFSSPFAIKDEIKNHFLNKTDQDEVNINHNEINISALKIEATTNDVNNNMSNKLSDDLLAKQQVNNVSKSYWDRKSLPPTKRFKNYNQEQEESALFKQMQNVSNNQENMNELPSDSSMKDPRGTPIINDENKFSNNVLNDKASPEETRAQNDGENKLLGLANIALLRAKK